MAWWFLLSELTLIFRNRKKLELHKNTCKNKDFYIVIMSSEDTKILWFNQFQKSNKAPFIIYENLERIIKKMNLCKNTPENSSTIKVSQHIPSDFWISLISLFRSIEKKHDVYWGKHFMKKFCEYLREHAVEIINFKK